MKQNPRKITLLKLKKIHTVVGKYNFLKSVKYTVIHKDGLNFVRQYFLNCRWYVNNLHNI